MIHRADPEVYAKFVIFLEKWLYMLYNQTWFSSLWFQFSDPVHWVAAKNLYGHVLSNNTLNYMYLKYTTH